MLLETKRKEHEKAVHDSLVQQQTA